MPQLADACAAAFDGDAVWLVLHAGLVLPAVSAGTPELWEQPIDVVHPEAGQESCGSVLPGLPWQESLSSSVHNPLWDEESTSSSRLESSPRAQTLGESAVVCT